MGLWGMLLEKVLGYGTLALGSQDKAWGMGLLRVLAQISPGATPLGYPESRKKRHPRGKMSLWGVKRWGT